MAARKQTATVDIKLRMKEPVRADIERSAKRRGISMNAEMVERLERTLEREALLPELMKIRFGEGLAGILLMAGTVMSNAGAGAKYQKHGMTSEPWVNDPDAYAAAVEAAKLVLDEFQPEGGRSFDAASSVARRYAARHIQDIVNEEGPYPFGQKEQIDQVRKLLGHDVIAQSHQLREWRRESAKIEEARNAAEKPK